MQHKSHQKDKNRNATLIQSDSASNIVHSSEKKDLANSKNPYSTLNATLAKLKQDQKSRKQQSSQLFTVSSAQL